ncbi:MAG: DUF2877 domain-containing protein [Tissierellia bacterium]|nr:DUF2877 domain-containing protein [Tissierellia bacterium]
MKILKSSHYCYEILKQKKSFDFFSKNSKAIYFKNNKDMVCLQINNTELSPISLISDLNSLKDFITFPSTSLIYKENTIFLDSYKFKMNTNLYQSKIKIFSSEIKNKDILILAMENAKFILYKYPSHGINQIYRENIKDKQIIIELIESRLNKIQDLIKNKEYDLGLKLLSKSIGLGLGLTPSMDDFITGFIASQMNFSLIDGEIFNKFIENVENQSYSTTPVSQEFLRLSIKGHFSKPIVDFFASLYRQDSNLDSIGSSFANLGASSGLDSLSGIYFYLESLLD